ncbi:hypothetical protein D554_0139 [Bordetella holmesii 30539]|uniref:N-acetyltransferase YedL n=1 Tax=Bordetella holmesii 1058 TaxID=1247648 RepID=A0ABN0RZP1_9BORD|nr:hypothetical protein D560_0139 [Bordetella holmesii ATCC 51541]AIT24831.1 hypothetical protein D558_0135 [Bordetella holmesii 44057]EWM45402.1 hypothetical protein D557_3403 [Bordetella holmesii 70147]EWM48187.1 hypothetical protein D556_0136 [Bordetella holmesii 41130]EWM49516.1 hypothetical protein D555_0137 [Bordetella holmesii 35009]EXF90334.1 hypothetical protein D554_0139 [Bordetella holmesii 30539]EXX94696.1 hypothetical protein D559_2116 [Bordetella holmesii 1058]
MGGRQALCGVAAAKARCCFRGYLSLPASCREKCAGQAQRHA